MERLYTDAQTDITEWITSGKTTHFNSTSRESEKAAEGLAYKRKSYVYTVHGWDEEGFFVHKGYAVPN